MTVTDEIRARKAALATVIAQEHKVLEAASIPWGSSSLPRPYLRSQLREWFYPLKRQLYVEIVRLEKL